MKIDLITLLLVTIALLIVINIAVTFRPYQLILVHDDSIPYTAYRLNTYTGTVNAIMYDTGTYHLYIMKPALPIEKFDSTYNPFQK